MPGKLLQTSPPAPARPEKPGELRVIDLDLASYRQIAERVQAVRSVGLSFLKAGIATKNLAFNAQNNTPLANLFVTMLQGLGIEADKFASSTGLLSEVSRI